MAAGLHALTVGYGRWLFKHRNKVFTAVLCGLLLGLPPVTIARNVALDRWWDACGFLIALAGQGLRAAVIGLEYIKRGGINKQIHADKLVTSGMFAHCRNPLYVGNLLIIAGLFVMHNHPLVYLLGGAYFITAYIAIVAAEEAYLHDKFGVEFERYCVAVNRWLPRWRGLSDTLGSMEMNWRRMVQKDYGTAYFWLAGAGILMILERLHGTTTGYSNADLPAPGLYLLAVTALFFVVWRLKRLRYFQPRNG